MDRTPEDDDVIDAEELGLGDGGAGPQPDADLPEGIAAEPSLLETSADGDIDLTDGDVGQEAAGSSVPTAGDEQRVVLYDPLRRYFQELKRFTPLTPEEEHELAIRYQKTGDVDAAYRLTTAHLRLVVRIAFDFKRTWLNLLDLIQEGNVGLLLAIRKFDPYRGIRLSTYAAWWIRAYIIKFLLDNWRLVKVGTTNARRRLLFNLRKEKEALLAQGIEPLPKLLAERLSVSEQDVVEVDRSLGMTDLSFEARTSADSDQVVGETLASSDPGADTVYEEKERRDLLNRKLEEFAATLDEREGTVFRERLLAEEPATLQVLGERFGLTREGLRQVEKRLLKRLREFLTAEVEDLRALDVELPAPDHHPRTARSAPAARAPGRASRPRPDARSSTTTSPTRADPDTTAAAASPPADGASRATKAGRKAKTPRTKASTKTSPTDLAETAPRPAAEPEERSAAATRPRAGEPGHQPRTTAVKPAPGRPRR